MHYNCKWLSLVAVNVLYIRLYKACSKKDRTFAIKLYFTTF